MALQGLRARRVARLLPALPEPAEERVRGHVTRRALFRLLDEARTGVPAPGKRHVPGAGGKGPGVTERGGHGGQPAGYGSSDAGDPHAGREGERDL